MNRRQQTFMLGLGLALIIYKLRQLRGTEAAFVRAVTGRQLGDSQTSYWIKSELESLNPWTKVSGAYDYWTSRGVVGGLKEAAGTTADTAGTLAYGTRGPAPEPKKIPWWVWALGGTALLAALAAVAAPRALPFARKVSELQREHAREGIKLGRELVALRAGLR